MFLLHSHHLNIVYNCNCQLLHKWLILVVYRSALSLVMTWSIDKPVFLLMLPNSKTKGNGSRTTKQYPQEICTRFCCVDNKNPWWRHQMETFSALLTLCVGNWPVTGESPSQRPATRSFDGFFDLRLNKRLSKQRWDRWFETPSCPLWRHCNEHIPTCFVVVVLEVFCGFISIYPFYSGLLHWHWDNLMYAPMTVK